MRPVRFRCAALLATLAFVLFPLAHARAGEETPLSGPMPQAQTAPGTQTLPEEFWYIDEAVRAKMATDPNVVPMYHAAVKARHDRRTAGLALYIIGAPTVLAGFVLFVAPTALGFKNTDKDIYRAEVISTSIAAAGSATVVAAALCRSLPSSSEKTYIKYMKEKYNVIPVVELPRLRSDGVVAWNAVHLQF